MARGEDEPFYSMDEIRELIESEKVRFRKKALDDALEHFDYDGEEILAELLRLREKDWHKTINGAHLEITFDVYKPSLGGRKAYIKFGIDDETGCLLLVASFKER